MLNAKDVRHRIQFVMRCATVAVAAAVCFGCASVRVKILVRLVHTHITRVCGSQNENENVQMDAQRLYYTPNTTDYPPI